VTLSGDLFFVNKAPFSTTISDHIKFTTAEHIAARKIISLVQASKHVQAVFAARGFHVKSMLMDGEFLPLKYDLSSIGIILNTTAANEHVPKIERQIRVIKERVRATRHTLPFKVIPLTMLIELTYSSTLWINALPPKARRRFLHFKPTKHHDRYPIRLPEALQTPIRKLGTSASRAKSYQHTGSLNSWSHLSWPNPQHPGSYKFLNFRTGKRITRRRWTQLPMPQEVIDRDDQLGKADGQP
jgi:hypothetical protein